MIKSLLIVDIGSTTTKAHYFDDEGLHTEFSKTTVEKPNEDVMVGVRQAVTALEARTKANIWGKTDLFLATSSAGGGLQMIVAGLVRRITARSAEKAALSSGAVIMDVLAIDDGKPFYETINHLARMRPDIILLAGGEDGGAVSEVVRMAEMIATARPKAKYSGRVPLVYAGNIAAREAVQETLEGTATIFCTENVRPTIHRENPVPARNKIHELFMEHVMSKAPGYDKLKQFVSAPVLPTPAAVSGMVQQIALKLEKSILAVDIGGATTDVFTVIDGIHNRTVSANVGMSYSAGNSLFKAGAEQVRKWIEDDIGVEEIKNAVMNKVLNPTSLPQTPLDKAIEAGLAREALKLALQHHVDFIEAGNITESEVVNPPPLLRITSSRIGKDAWSHRDIGLILCSGGILSYGERAEVSRIAIDAFEPCGVTVIGVDHNLLLPHLGALRVVDPQLAWEYFHRFCYVELGTCVAPVGTMKEGQIALKIEDEVTARAGEFMIKKLEGKHTVTPGRGLDIGKGRGKSLDIEFNGQAIIDCRGRPMHE